MRAGSHHLSKPQPKAPDRVSRPRPGATAEPAWRGPGSPLGRDQVLALQRDAGNTAVNELLEWGDEMTGLNMTGTYRAVRRDLIHAIASHLLEVQEDLNKRDTHLDHVNEQLALLDIIGSLQNWETYAEADDKLVDVEKMNREIERMKAETAQLEAEVDHKQGHPGYRSAERILVLGQMALGQLDRVELTDAVFFMRHPERRGKPLDPSKAADTELVKEWTGIRGHLVAEVFASELGQWITTGRQQAPAKKGKGKKKG